MSCSFPVPTRNEINNLNRLNNISDILMSPVELENKCANVTDVLQKVNEQENGVSVEFTPTIPHCSMATLIGLSIKVKLLRSLPDRFKVRRCWGSQTKLWEMSVTLYSTWKTNYQNVEYMYFSNPPPNIEIGDCRSVDVHVWCTP